MAEHVDTIGELTDTDAADPVNQTASGAAAPRTTARGAPKRRWRLGAVSPLRAALLFGCTALVGVTSLIGWLAVPGQRAAQVQHQRSNFVQAARQGALNLTTISYTEADADIKRIMDSATGTFYDDFQKRSAAFVDVLGKTQSKTEGTITEAGIESMEADSARVLVAVAVKTSNSAATDPQPRLWRMRIDVQKVGDAVKVANVQFVP
jgi:Mce-associated membrane protein